MKRLVYISVLFIFFSCRKDVNLNIPDYTQKVVIEASIETGGPAIVYLSYSVPYFGEFDFKDPQKTFIKGGFVTVTDGVTTDTLKELFPDLGYFYAGSKLLGQQGKTYVLTVRVGERSFNAGTTILNPVSIDSLYFSSQTDSLGYMGTYFTDPAGSGDYYRWLAKRLGRDQYFAAPFNSVFDDKFVDGTQVELVYNRGRQPDVLSDPDDTERGYYRLGDKVVVKLCKIGRAEYDFWLTYYQNKTSNGNPFSAPANVKSMFNDYEHAFGAFTGYSPTFDTLTLSNE